MSKLACVVIVLVASGCGGSDGPGSGPLSAEQARDVCESSCMRDEECGGLDTGETVESCANDCADDIDDGGYREDVFLDAVSCIESTACGQDQEECLFMCEPTSAHEAYETRCREKATECGFDGSADEACETTPDAAAEVGGLCVYTPEVMDAFRACLEEDCAAINACFDEVVAQYNLR